MYAKVIVDISHEKLDKGFDYRIPAHLDGEVHPGVQVNIPFGKGNRIIQGYVIEVKETAGYAEDKIKEITSVVKNSIPIESRLISLAWFIKENYGSSMNQALKTVIPIKETKKSVVRKVICLIVDDEKLNIAIDKYERKHATARLKLLYALKENREMAWTLVQKLGVTLAVAKALEEEGLVLIKEETVYRNPIKYTDLLPYDIKLNKEQEKISKGICAYIDNNAMGYGGVHLIHGITGSGKTEVYMDVIEKVIAKGQEIIVLIPEIALTYQTVMRFYRKFGDKVSIINSKLSAGERFDQFEKAKKGEIKIMIGPRSAVFTPFRNLGLIIIDEEHEGSYKSETAPRYHARETAIYRAKGEGAAVILGSATPAIDSYYKALTGEYILYELKSRAKESKPATVHIVDMREELAMGNRTMFSGKLDELIKDRLAKKQQIMLFINRRGYAGFVSCRNCGTARKCPHCDVGLTLHNNSKLICHYCGYETPMPKTCPQCDSKYIAAFGTGTQKVEEAVKKMYPAARTLRMDMDTTSKKDGYEQILSQFSNGEADVLIGTQMIVKGHDFPNVTLVGIIAADMSLYASDYRSSEKTFQLLTQAEGRAGRGSIDGEAVIQTYSPENGSIIAASKQDYTEFYNKEILYRTISEYPPVVSLMAVQLTSKDNSLLSDLANKIKDMIGKAVVDIKNLRIIGPADANVAKINDVYRKVIYIKSREYDILVKIKDFIEAQFEVMEENKRASVQFDFNPMSGF
ncbi:MAG: primosomal protein N' [Lachnospiraceae bacterium]|nr:primosomal protein N' [Lachnospiraceae bacterium]